VKKLVGAQIGVGIQQDGAGRLTIAPGPADFLVITLDAARQRGMNHGANIGLVDAHAKCDGGDDHLQAPLLNNPCTRSRSCGVIPA
jgi:hypothetical protein